MSSPQLFCTECGARLEPGANACAECGTAVENPEDPVDLISTPARLSPAKKSGLGVVVLVVSVVLLVLAGSAGALWWFVFREGSEFGNETKIITPPSKQTPPPSSQTVPALVAPIPVAPNLLVDLDFDGAVPREIEGEGGIAGDPLDDANRAWQLNGDAESFFSCDLPATRGSGSIRIAYRVLVPEATRMVDFEGQPMKGVRIRTRFTDRYESSAVSDTVLSSKDSWQPITIEFEDTNSGPYRVSVEAIWFRGPVYFDELKITGP